MAKILVNGNTPDHPILSDDYHTVVIPEGYSIETELAPHIQNAAAYIVLPGSDPLLTLSKLVDKQYASKDKPLSTFGKPVIIYDPDDNNPFVALVRDLIAKGMVKQGEHELYKIIKNFDEIPGILKKALTKYEQYMPPAVLGEHAIHTDPVPLSITQTYGSGERPDINIAVFCSASTKDPRYLDMAFQTGQMIAQQGWGVVFGAGNVSMMGQVAKGAKSKGGYVTGHTTPVFYDLEFKGHTPKELANYINEVTIHPDIYVRMTQMYKQSDALVVMPGGLGTVQEMFAAFAVRERDPDTAHKPIVLGSVEEFLTNA